MKFKFIEHTADVGIEAWGDDLAEAFENAAIGLFEIMTDTSKVEQTEKREFEVESEDKQSLLYDFLEKFLILRDSEGLMFSKFKVSIEGNKLKAEAWGEEFNSEKHESKTEVKAITYMDMQVGKKDDKHFVRVIVDI
ncbi:MAG: archease [Candidatus Aenigmarchaeota archaeon]|nr:archease [Candidatus Aenigmarchaeota archaeon]